MKKILPIILILIGHIEIMIVVMDIKMPIMITIVLGIIFIALGVKTLIDTSKDIVKGECKIEFLPF